MKKKNSDTDLRTVKSLFITRWTSWSSNNWGFNWWYSRNLCRNCLIRHLLSILWHNFWFHPKVWALTSILIFIFECLLDLIFANFLFRGPVFGLISKYWSILRHCFYIGVISETDSELIGGRFHCWPYYSRSGVANGGIHSHLMITNDFTLKCMAGKWKIWAGYYCCRDNQGLYN